jgi:hypothetical protein
MSAFKIEDYSILGLKVESLLDDDDDEKLLKKMTAYAKKHFDGIKAGDIVSIESETGYRNEGVFIWNGKKVVNLYTKLDDYGSVPPEIEISDDNDVDAYSWERFIHHNKIVWYSPEIRDRIKNSLNVVNGSYTAQVDIRGKTWNFILLNDEIVDKETGSERTVEQLKKALPKNIIAFDTAEDEDHSNNVYMHFPFNDVVHGKPRNPKKNAVNKTKRVGSKEKAEKASPKTTTRRIETELAAARKNVAQLELQLTAIHLNVVNLNR